MGDPVTSPALVNEPAWRALTAAFLSSLGARQCAKGTVGAYRLHLTRMASALADSPPDRCSTGNVRLALGRVRASWPGSYQSANSRNMLANACRSFFRWAADTGHIVPNLAGSIKVRHDDGAATVPISPADIQHLLTTINSSHDRHRLRDEALFAFYAFTGVRRNEALSVTAADYQRQHGTVLIRGKGGCRKRLPIIGPLRQILEAYLEKIPIAAGDTPLFPGKSALRQAGLSGRQADKLFHKWRRLAGLPADLTIHSFRAGLASTLYNDNHDLLLVSRLLGHRDIRTTCRYITVMVDGRWALEHAFSKH